MIKVCDAIMGTGKSSAAITYMNEHKSDKFIYITPYLDEATRIKKGCPDLDFVEPSNKLKKYSFKKSEHTAALIEEGRNITTTHQSFKRYTHDTLDLIRRQGYILIIDENVEVLEKFDCHPDDIRIALDAGYITESNGIYSPTEHTYNGSALRELFGLIKSRELIRMDNGSGDDLFYWTLPPDLLTSFKDVYILTYLFEGQSLRYFMDIYNIGYERIGIERMDGGGYRFGNYPGYTPEYVYDLKRMLHILDKDKLNEVGDDYYALSMNWFKKDNSALEKLKNNVSNFFNNVHRDIPAEKRLWGSYNDGFNAIRGKGYTKSFLTFNARATNAYKDRECLVYIANLFMNVNEKVFYETHGVTVDEDTYALSVMVQWIWRSAIREGREVYLYIPSKRMRSLLINWIESLSNGGDKINDEIML